MLCCLLALATSAYGAGFECAFIQEKYSSGKSNQASCSMLPEEVFSTRWHTPARNAHCKIESVYSFHDLLDVFVDIGQKIVRWTHHFGLTEEAKPQQKAYYLKEGLSEQEAEEKISSETKTGEVYRIVGHHVSSTNIYIDEITGKMNDPPKKVPEHTFMFESRTNRMFYLYVPEASGHAILFEPSGTADASWVSMRFGKCRKVK